VIVCASVVAPRSGWAACPNFATAVNYGTGSFPQSVTTGDFNGDGRGDLAVANESSHNVSILLGNGNGTFGAAVNNPAGSFPRSVADGDFNGDGKRDLAVANTGSNTVSILLGPTGEHPASVRRSTRTRSRRDTPCHSRGRGSG
jgi:hypothetical protein